jgi:putative ABC transport system ATP-binding protein
MTEPSNEPPIAEVLSVSRWFGPEGARIHALREVSLTVRRGEFVAIMGPSGSGKTTLMNVLGLLDRPSSGQYFLDGEPADSLTDNERAALRATRIGFVFQAFYLMRDRSVLDNIALGLRYIPEIEADRRLEICKEAATLVGLSNRLSHKPAVLSGGERQRAAIARAIAARGDILLADEPTGNLDRRTGDSILDTFSRMRSEIGVAVVLVTHDPHAASYADRTMNMVDGRFED